MSPDEQERADRIERGVLARIDRRAARARGLGRGIVAVAVLGLVVLGIAQLRVSGSGGSSTGAAGGSAASAAASSDSGRTPLAASGTAGGAAPIYTAAPDKSLAAPAGPRVVVRCHATSAAASAVRTTASGGVDGPFIAELCDEAFERSRTPIVLCRVSDTVLAAYPADADPLTLCSRNGVKPVR